MLDLNPNFNIELMNSNKPNVAIVFYGLTRSLVKTFPSFKTNIFDVLNDAGYSYTTFMHTYHIEGAYTNTWAKEYCTAYDNTQHTVLNPDHLIIDSHDEIVKTLSIESYYTKLGNWTNLSSEMTRFLIRNLALGLYSKKRIMEYLRDTGIPYDYVIIMRPDYTILTKFNIDWFSELGPNSIIIPERDWYRGCNDRLCIATLDNALYYGSFFDYLLEYSRTKSIVSEHYCLDMIQKRNLTIIKKPINYSMIRLTSDS